MKKELKNYTNKALALLMCSVLSFGSLSMLTPVNADADGARLSDFSLAVDDGSVGLELSVEGLSNPENTKLKVDGVSYDFNADSKAVCYVAAKDFDKKLNVELYSGNKKISFTNSEAVNGSMSFSMKDCLHKLETKDDAMGRLAKAVEDYGTCAFYYFGDYDSIPVNVKTADLSSYRSKMKGKMPAGVTYLGSNLDITDSISLRHYYSVDELSVSPEIYIDGKESSLKKANGMTYVETTGIKISDIDHAYKVKVVGRGQTSEMEYSVLSYVYDSTVQDNDPLIGKFMMSLYRVKEAYEECINGGSEIIVGEYVKYSDFGAKGDGKTNDYSSIVAAHEYANEHDLPVKADPGAVYYVGHMDPSNPKGASIKTDTDWGDAKFIIDDSVLTLGSNGKCSEQDCCLFTVEASVKSSYKWINPGSGVYLGIDPNLKDYPDYNAGVSSSFPSLAKNYINKSFGKNTTKLETVSGMPFEKALYDIRSSAFKRWGRNGSAYASSDGRDQEEVFILNSDGTISSDTKLQWDWSKIESIKIYPIDEKTLTVKGGEFRTRVNTMRSDTYIRRGIAITRSNVLMQGVKHYLDGEDKKFTADSIAKDSSGNPIVRARLGAPYQGFFRLDHCANVTLKDCLFSNHLRTYGKQDSSGVWDNVNSTAPYDYYAENCANITIDHCSCDKTTLYTVDYVKGILGLASKVSRQVDQTGILDDSRWGTTGTNYCKGIVVKNGSAINRIDAHKGTYNLTVKDSKIGCKGIAAVGFGDMNIENTTVYADFFINLRRDFGSAWFGDINIKNCTWVLPSYTARLIYANYIPTYKYGYDTITEGGVTYYSALPTNINIDGLTLDGSNVKNIALFSLGLQIFSSTLTSVKDTVNDEYLNDRSRYVYPLLPTKEINLKNLTVIRHPELTNNTFKVCIQRENATTHDEYLYHNTKLNYDSASTKIVSAK